MPELPRTALLTGAAKRLGRAMALMLAEEGFDIALHYHASATEAEATAAEIRARGRRVLTIRADLEREAEVRTIFARAAALGPIGLLVNNASIFELDRLATLDPALLHRHIAINLTAPLLLCHDLVAQLPDPAEGLIVNMLDERVHNPTPNYLSYTVTRTGLWGATQVMARDLAPRVRVNAIGPGPAVPAPGWSRERFEKLCAQMPLQRGTSPEEIAMALRFILHARSMTGQMITLDGGQQMGWLTPAGAIGE